MKPENVRRPWSISIPISTMVLVLPDAIPLWVHFSFLFQSTPHLWFHRAMKFPRRKASGGKQEGYFSLKTCTIWYIINSYSHQRWDNPFGNKLPFWNSFPGCFHFHVFELKKKKKVRELSSLPWPLYRPRGRYPQCASLACRLCFRLKTIKVQKTQEDTLTFP